METIEDRKRAWEERKAEKNRMKARIARLHRSGMSRRQIARTVGLSETTVRFLMP